MAPDTSCDAAVAVLVLGWLPLGVGLLLGLIGLIGVRREIDHLASVLHDRWRAEDAYAALRQRFPKE